VLHRDHFQSPLSLLWHKVYRTANTIALSVCTVFQNNRCIDSAPLCWNLDRAEVLYILKQATGNRQDPYFQLCFKTNQLDSEQIDDEMFSLSG